MVIPGSLEHLQGEGAEYVGTEMIQKGDITVISWRAEMSQGVGPNLEQESPCDGRDTYHPPWQKLPRLIKHFHMWQVRLKSGWVCIINFIPKSHHSPLPPPHICLPSYSGVQNFSLKGIRNQTGSSMETLPVFLLHPSMLVMPGTVFVHDLCVCGLSDFQRRKVYKGDFSSNISGCESTGRQQQLLKCLTVQLINVHQNK